MDEKQFQELIEKFGKEAAEKFKADLIAVEKRISEQFKEVIKGQMTLAEFTNFKNDVVGPLQEQIKKLEGIDTLEKAIKEQGDVLKQIMESNGGQPKRQTLEEFLESMVPQIKKLKEEGKFMVISGKQLKAAGVTSISGSIGSLVGGSALTSPYLPGPGGDAMEIFDIVKNPNYILSRVDIGSTNRSLLPWINETTYWGTPTVVAEGVAKPLTEHEFTTEFSKAKKIAGYVTITEEFEQDVPELATRVRRMLQDDVIRAFDDYIQTDIFALATGYAMPNFVGNVQAANLWDAILALMAQVRVHNFIPNAVGINPQTYYKMQVTKDNTDAYLNPPFAQEILSMLTQANKLPVNWAIAGDLKQYKVDIYKDFYLKIGLVNDDLIKNQFTIVGELRFHNYISANRRTAIVKGDLEAIVNSIDGTPGS